MFYPSYTDTDYTDYLLFRMATLKCKRDRKPTR